MEICIEDIADALEMCMDGWEQFLNIKTGEIASLSDGMWVDRDGELEEEIESSTFYVRLPNQYEINEWHIMEEFAEAIPSEWKREKLMRALHGKKAYRRFKDEIINLDVEDEYYAFRFLVFCKIAKE